MFSWIKKSIDWTFSLLGYYDKLPLDVNNLVIEYNNRLFEIDGLNLSVGYLERLRNEINAVVTAVLMLQGHEELKLENGVLASVIDKRLETVFTANQDGSLTCKVQIRPTIQFSEAELQELEEELNKKEANAHS